MTDRVDLQEFIGGFVAEAEELVATAHALLLEIESANAAGTTRPKAVRDLFRALHTIKGLAGMVGVEPIVEIAHALETILRAADRSGGRLRRGGVEVALQGVGAIGERVRTVASGGVPDAAPDALLDAIASTDAASERPMTAPVIAPAWDARLQPSEQQQLFHALREGHTVWQLAFVPTEDHARNGITIAVVRSRLEALGEIIKVAPRTLGAARKGVAFDFLIQSEATREQLAEAASTSPTEVSQIDVPADLVATTAESAGTPLEEDRELVAIGRSIVRVELSRLDELQEQLSLLIVSRFRLEREIAQLAERGIDVRRLRDVSELQARQLRDLRRAMLRVRMVRVSEVLEPLALLVRTLTRADVKEVRLEIEARDTEVDKAVADRLLPALVHLVRNAVDHAIEGVPDRLAKGKPRAGLVQVSCEEIGGSQLQLVITDDGRGIDRAAIERRCGHAIGSDEELLDVLTTPGFSTRDSASQTSGRGLGMDIVRRVTDELGGELRLETELGRRTVFRMTVPLTIAIVDAFAFSCGSQSFVVPVAGVEEIVDLGDELRMRPPSTTRGELTLVHRRGGALPVLSLGSLLSIEGSEARKAVVIRRNGELVAFAIDRMLGRHEVVVRPVADPLVRMPGVAGATDLGDGRPTLILDLAELLGRTIPDTRRSS